MGRSLQAKMEDGRYYPFAAYFSSQCHGAQGLFPNGSVEAVDWQNRGCGQPVLGI